MVNKMSGVILKPAQHEELQATLNAYFSDTVPDVVNGLAQKCNTTQEAVTELFVVGRQLQV